jgi:hypothetical protein
MQAALMMVNNQLAVPSYGVSRIVAALSERKMSLGVS